MTTARTASTAAPRAGVVVTGALFVATAIGWVATWHTTRGMDMGPATDRGSAASFARMWIPMMAAMMLPSIVPVVTRSRWLGRRSPALGFAATYLAVWWAAGTLAYPLVHPHSLRTAGVAVALAGLYELSPAKRRLRERCRDAGRSGLAQGLACLGSSAGLMAVLVAFGVMNVAWALALSVLVLAQKATPPRPWFDVPAALVIVSVGIWAIVAPGTVPDIIAASST